MSIRKFLIFFLKRTRWDLLFKEKQGLEGSILLSILKEIEFFIFDYDYLLKGKNKRFIYFKVKVFKKRRFNFSNFFFKILFYRIFFFQIKGLSLF